MKKEIKLDHHICDGCCMWSGIEDVYAMKIAQAKDNKLPDGFLFSLASFGEAVYLKFKDEDRPVRFGLGDGRTNKTYGSLAEGLKLDYKISTGATYDYSLAKVKKEIDKDKPVILGPIDMYYLPYLKMYHKYHIPIHYVTMVGYDDEKQEVYIYDCGRLEQQKLTYAELADAWNVEKNDFIDKNGFVRFSIGNDTPDEYNLVKYAIEKKAEMMLSPKPRFVGVTAFEQIAEEFPLWKKSMSKKAYMNALKSLAEGFGTVPQVPSRMYGAPDEDKYGFLHRGCYDRIGLVMSSIGQKYSNKCYSCAGEILTECGLIIEEITEYLVYEYCNLAGYRCHYKIKIDEARVASEISDRFLRLASMTREAYEGIIQYKEQL